jgi:glycerol-3-phosphate cytidylyltransferase-like family protein
MFTGYTGMCADMCQNGYFNYLDSVYEKMVELAGDAESVQLIVGIHSNYDTSTYKRVPLQVMDNHCKMIRRHKRVTRVMEYAPLELWGAWVQRYGINAVFTAERHESQMESMYQIPRKMVHVIP